MWSRILTWAVNVGGAVYRWVVANKGLILKWIGSSWPFVEIINAILKRVFS